VNPWIGFINLAFSTDPTTPAPDQGFGAATFGTASDDQYTLEADYRFQLCERLAITPDLQLVKNPPLNPAEDLIWVAGLRARLAF
jgi:porin